MWPEDVLHLDYAHTVSRPIRRARMFLSTISEVTTHLVLDADSNELVRYPVLADGWRLEGESLSADGTRIVFKAIGENGLSRGLVVMTIATGEQKIFDVLWDGTADAGATLSHDNSTLALMSSVNTDRTTAVTLLDVASGYRRTLWTTKDWAADWNCVSWSPTGRFVTANCYISRKDRAYVAVIDAATGDTVRIVDRACTLVPHGTWIDDHMLLVTDWRRPWTPTSNRDWLAINVLTGESQHYTWERYSTQDHWLAYLDGQVISSAYFSSVGEYGEYAYSVSPLGSADRKPFMTIQPQGASIRLIDVAPLAKPSN